MERTADRQMKISIKLNPFELYSLLIVLFLSAAYLWYTLPIPKMDDQMRLLIIIISMALIFILGNSLKNELCGSTLELQ
jgi:hypothetical protein